PQTAGQRLQVSAEDAAGNLSNSAAITAPNLETPVDDTPPAAPTGLVINAGGSQLSGRGEAGTTVSVRDTQGNLIATSTVAADGTFSVSLDPAVIDGSALQVSLTDAAGNVSEAASVRSPDLIAPAQPTDLTLAAGVTLTGSGEPGASVQVRNAAGAVIGSGVVAANGQFSVELTPAQANGEFIDVRLVDAAGNESIPLTFQAPDITAPVAPFDLAVNADGSVLSGRGEPGSRVRVTDARGVELGSAVVNAAGSFALSLVPAQTEGQSLQATALDAAGNVSPATSVSAPNLETPVDTIPPDAPSGLVINAGGAQLSGRGEPGTTVTVRDALGRVIASDVVAPDGTFSVVLAPAVIDGSALRVDLTDAAGNVSETVSVLSPDLLAPAQPTDLALAEGVTLTGSGEPGASVEVRDAAGAVIGRGVVGADGQFSLALNPAQANGEFIDIHLIDAAGNESIPLAFQAPDITAPEAVTEVVV
ncbi:Ig-like domain-containing protein, partial [Pseudomonas cremoricolorata]|uniref:Ig-like domain-containing protein n=1 Tax=Pseudomonas cremoricolorata TaxID=157783 RepID=UPI0005341B20